MEVKKLAKLLKEIGLSKNDIIGNLIFLVDDATKEQCEILKIKLYDYIESQKASGIEIENADIIEFIETLKVEMGISRYQYLPFHKFVRYIGKTGKDLKSGEIYQVAVVYCKDKDLENAESYLINVKEDEQKEFKSELFQQLQPSKVLFKKLSGKNILQTKGLEEGVVYNVEKLSGNKIIFTNGQSCWDYEAEILDFAPLKEDE